VERWWFRIHAADTGMAFPYDPDQAGPLPASRARTGARRRRRRPVRVLASVAIAGLIGTALTVTIGAASVQHPPGALPSAPPGHPAVGIAAAPPARQPTSASPSRQARRRTSPGDTGTLQMDASNHRTITTPQSGRETIRRHRHGSEADHGHDHGQGNGNGNGQGQGNGNGNGQGQGNGIAASPPRSGTAASGRAPRWPG